MAEQTEYSFPASEPPLAPTGEDAGRLDGHASRGRLIAIIVALVLFSEVAPFQSAMISYVLPKIAQSFPSAGANVTWAVTILGVAGGASMALLGKLGDLIGKKKVLLLCGLLFLIGSLISALTGSWALFLVGRALGGASWGMTAVEYGTVRDIMPRRWIPVTIGIIGTGFGVSGVIAPLICGALTDHFSWRSVFWFLTIYMVATFPVVMLAVPESPLRLKQRFDILGAALFGVGVGAVLVYISEGSSWGWTAASSLGYLIGGLAVLAAFCTWEMRTREPMMELKLLRAPKVMVPMVVAFLITGIFAMIGISIAYMFETPQAATLKGEVLAGVAAQTHQPMSVVSQIVSFRGDVGYAAGYSVLQMAVHITIWTALFGMICGPLGGHISRKVGARLPLLISAGSLMAACALWVVWHSTWQDQVFIGLFYGIGFGFYYAANPNLLMDAVPADRQGVASGMLAVFGAVGTSAAIAVVTAILAAHPFQTVITAAAGHSVVTAVPGVYTNTAYSLIYALVGIVPAAVGLILVFFLRAGRTPALGGGRVAERENAAALAD
jgi:MFS family permease